MADYPKNVMEFRDQFRGEEECRAYLEQLRWPEGVRCPDCHAKEIWTMRSPFYRCQRCGYDFTVTAGTLFADTHKPLRVWFEAVWHVTSQKSGVSALGLQRALGLVSAERCPSYEAFFYAGGHPTAPGSPPLGGVANQHVSGASRVSSLR